MACGRESAAAPELRSDQQTHESINSTSQEEDHDLARALARLPETHRSAIVLRFYADWSNDEIALCLDKRAVTVRSWIHRGLTQLRRDLKR